MGPQLLDDPVVSIPAAIAALLIAYGVIWRKGLVPIYHFFQDVKRIAVATPILVEIAEEFRPNGGNSLRDVVERIESKVDDAVIVAETTKTTLEDRWEEHLTLPAWHQERDDVLSRLRRLEEQELPGTHDV